MQVTVAPFTHAEFSSIFQRDEANWSSTRDDGKENSRRAASNLAYGWMARYSALFLKAYLKNDSASRNLLRSSPQPSGLPGDQFAIRYRAASGIAPTLTAFREAVGREGFSHAKAIYVTIRKNSPTFDLDPYATFIWAEELKAGNHALEAIDLLKLYVEVHPDDSFGYYSLGEAAELTDQRALAVTSYRQAVAKNPDNVQAKEKLRSLMPTH